MKPLNRHIPVRRAFTLIELVLAVALLGVLVGGIAWYSTAVARGKERITLATERAHDIGMLFDQLERAIRTSIADAGEASGISGTADELTVYARGVWLTADAAMPHDLLKLNVSNGQLRTESSGSAEHTHMSLPFGRVRFRYLNEQWGETFDTRSAGRLPRAIEVAIWFDAIETEDDIFAMDEEADDDDGFADDVFGFEDGPEAFDESDLSDAFGFESDDAWGPADRIRIFAVPDAVDSGSSSHDAEVFDA